MTNISLDHDRGSNRVKLPVLPAAPFKVYRGYSFDELTWHFFRFSLTAWRNRLVDTYKVRRDSKLRDLHQTVLRLIGDQKHWGGYDYGHRYLYQSCEELKLTGRRDTRNRVKEMLLHDYAQSRNVLDIGCNVGFISLALARIATSVTAFDHNPYVIAIAQKCAGYLGVQNVHFKQSSFADFSANQQFDVVLSLSNHATFDGPAYSTLKRYLDKCTTLLSEDGIIIFESHTSRFELRERSICQLRTALEERFTTLHQFMISGGTRLDRARLLYVGRQHPRCWKATSQACRTVARAEDVAKSIHPGVNIPERDR